MSPSESIQFNRYCFEIIEPVGVYIHVPFCSRKCLYCDFYSEPGYSDSDVEQFILALGRDISSAREVLGGGKPAVSSIYFGGGTPSLLSNHQIREILSLVYSAFAVQPSVEVTLEANPETLSASRCRELRKMTKVNRISLGVQSFDMKKLRALGRYGTPESALEAYTHLRKAGFDNVSLDLIFGVAGESPDILCSDLSRVRDLKPEHLSLYALTLPNSHPQFSFLPSQDESADLFELAIETFKKQGLAQYEISNFCRPGFESRHNLLYWEGGSYLGLGPAAASRIFQSRTFYHRKQISDFRKYRDSVGLIEWEFVSNTHYQTVLEACFLGLRMPKGLSCRQFLLRYGYDLRKAKTFQLFRDAGLIDIQGDILSLLPKGLLLADYVSRELVNPQDLIEKGISKFSD